MGDWINISDRIRSVAQVAAVEFCRQFANDVQIESGHLFRNWGVIAREVTIVGNGISERSHVTLSSDPNRHCQVNV